MWCIQEQSRGILLRQHRRRISIVLTSAFATWLSYAGEISFHAIPSCRFKIDLETPTSITSHNSLQHITILLNKPDEPAIEGSAIPRLMRDVPVSNVSSETVILRALVVIFSSFTKTPGYLTLSHAHFIPYYSQFIIQYTEASEGSSMYEGNVHT
jgi:hypothetical protein